MEEMTPEQKAHLETWAGKRDSLLTEISVLENQKAKLDEAVKASSESYTDLDIRANQLIGRIVELKNREEDLKTTTSTEVADLTTQKSVLQSEITTLGENLAKLGDKKLKADNDISFALETLRIMNDRIGSMDKIVGDTTEINRANVLMIEGLVADVKNGLESILQKYEKVDSNVNTIISELPKVFLEVQKKSLERDIIKKNKKTE